MSEGEQKDFRNGTIIYTLTSENRLLIVKDRIVNIRIYTIILQKVLQTIAAPLYLYYEQMINMALGIFGSRRDFYIGVNQRILIARSYEYSQLIFLIKIRKKKL